MRITVLLSALLAVASSAVGAEIQQRWVTQVAVGEDGGPCPAAGATLVLRAVDGEIVAKYPVSLEPEVMGIAVRPLLVKLPAPGNYTAHADLVRCDGTVVGTERIPVRVDGANEARAVQINGRGDKSSWRVEYFGITKEVSGNGIFRVEPQQPLAVKNVSRRSFQPCRLMLGAQVQVLELVGEEWVHGRQFQFPDEVSALGPGATVVLERPRAAVIRGKAKDEPEPTAFALKISVLPPKGSFQHLTEVANPALAGPFPGTCDTYYVDFEWPKPSDGNDEG